MDIVTGSTGCIGNVLIREMSAHGKEVIAFHRKNSLTDCIDDCPVEKRTGDVLDLESLVTAFKGINTVFHLASEISILPGSNKNLFEINVNGTKNVIKACIESKVKKLIFTSSIHAIEEPEYNRIIDETLPFDPESKMGVYNRTKAMASIEVMKAVDSGLDATIVCPTAVIGPYDFRVSLMGQLIVDYCSGSLSTITDGAYDFVDVRDVARGHMLAAEKGRKGQYYLLSGEKVTIDELMKMLNDITGIPLPRFKIPINIVKFFSLFTPVYYRISKTRPRFTLYSIRTIQSNSNISHKKATEELGYEPRPVKRSLEDTVAWFIEKGLVGSR